jgi:hypothetical protein
MHLRSGTPRQQPAQGRAAGMITDCFEIRGAAFVSSWHFSELALHLVFVCQRSHSTITRGQTALPLFCV